MAVEFRLLGDLEVRIDGRPVDVGHVQQRSVLVALLLDTNRVVPVDRLLDRVWGDHPPQRARGTLYSYLSRLRKALSTDDVTIARRPGGYVLTADPDTVDVHRFRRLVAQARTADDETAAVLLARALALWRGTPSPTSDTPWLTAVRDGLETARRAAELDRNEIALRCGRHAELLDELPACAAAHPLDERVAGQLMLALYRAGRRGEALACYQRIRLHLADDLGIDPSPPLRDLHRRVLTDDPALTVTPRARRPTATAARVPVPRQLPAPPRAFTGRTGELAELTATLDAGADQGGGAVTISVIDGTGGIGKTWLALRWAHDNLSRFPDGQLYVNLRGFDPAIDPVPPAVAVRGFLDALGVSPEAIPPDPTTQAALYRGLVADRRMLIVLDNARDSAQVIPLVPATGTVLVTSRHQLTSLITEHGARPLPLDVLTEADARQLLTGHLGADRVAAEPEAVTALLRHCAGLPLALGVVAARASIRPDLPLAAPAAELRESTTRLDALDGGELAVSLRTVLSCSSMALPRDAARMFGLLGLAPGPDIGLPAAASLAGLSPAAARVLLRRLIAAHLLHEPVSGRYRMHDLVRLFAAEQAGADCADPAGERHAALRRVLDHYLHTAHAADRRLAPHRDPISPGPPPAGTTPEEFGDHNEALAWFTAEHAALLATVDRAADAGIDTHVWQLAWALTTYFNRRGHWHDHAATYTAALRATRRMADRHAQAHAHRGIAVAYTWLGRYDDARTHLEHALGLFGRLGDLAGQALGHRTLARLSAQQGEHRQALPHDERALALYQAAGHRSGQATALNAIGWHHAHLGDHQRALTHCQRALALHQELGDRHGTAATWDSLGYIHLHLGHHQHATECYQHALDLFRDLDDRYQQAETAMNLGDTCRTIGDIDTAHTHWRHALNVLDELGHPRAEQVRARLNHRPTRPRGRLPVRSG
ncbi:SARP family transcriptional regulator [Actinoplanes capillaceus]|uniref:SARP family transcriptional regulator n=1 Tax=Actinoplanes campanulatus TaxID=113559 RepID=A0ABQ3WEU1_9ACTN|nr:BTAD domain-containing putative transcriptional regulator [Actinoplanes capillaceus]GID44426.1 SARP family transcriptional regulator [Actinoplanes capillaceus]